MNTIDSKTLDEKRKFIFERSIGTATDLIGITYTLLTPDLVQGNLLVSTKLHQPFGLLHGGISVFFAESLSSVGAWLNLSNINSSALCVEINANHISSMIEGILYGRATPLHLGKSIHVWEARLFTTLDETKERSQSEQLICVARCTLSIRSVS